MGSGSAWLEGDGKIILRGVAPVDRSNMRGMVHGKVDGFVPFDFQVPAVLPGEFVSATIELELEAIIRGKVRDELGNPVSKGWVAAEEVDAGWKLLDWGVPGDAYPLEDGRFELTGLKSCGYILEYVGTGYRMEPVEVSGLVGGQVLQQDLVLSRGLAVRGRVTWASGGPAAGVEVKLLGASDTSTPGLDSAERVVTTDGDGAFAMHGFGSGEPIGLQAVGFPPGSQPPQTKSKIKLRRWLRENEVQTRVTEAVPGGPALELVLGLSGGLVTGRVVDQAGQPVERFRVVVAPKLGDHGELPPVGRIRSRIDDGEGRFELVDLAPGEWGMEIRARGYLPSGVQWFRLPGDPKLEWVLGRRAGVQGVVFAGDMPVDAEVEASHTGMVDPDPPIGDQELHWLRADASKVGGFRFNGMTPGEWTLSARAVGLGESPPIVVQLKPGESRNVVLRFDTPGTLEGQVHSDWGGEGLLAKLWTAPVGDGIAKYLMEVAVEKDLSFSFGQVREGRYRVDLYRAVGLEGVREWIPQSTLGINRTIQVASGKTATVRFGPPGPASVVLTGRVTRGEEPAEGFMLAFSRDGKGSSPETQTDSNGEYRVVLPSPGTYSVKITDLRSNEDLANRKIELGEMRHQVMDFSTPVGDLVLELSFPGGKKPEGRIAGGAFQLIGMDETFGFDSSDGNRVYFRNVKDGTYRIRAKVLKLEGQDYTIKSPREVLFVGGQIPTVVKVEMEFAARLEGTVGNAKVRVPVFLFADARGKHRVAWDVSRNGRFSFDGLPSGEYWVGTERTPDPERALLAVSLGAGRTANVHLPSQE